MSSTPLTPEHDGARPAGTGTGSAGTGPDRESLRPLADRLGLADGWTVADVLAALDELPPLPEEEGTVTDWWRVMTPAGVELVRVFGPSSGEAFTRARAFPQVRRAAPGGGPLSARRMRTTHLQPAREGEAPHAYGVEVAGRRYVVRPAVHGWEVLWGVVPLEGGGPVVDGRATAGEAETDARADIEQLARVLGL
ncbi:hypothetical protein ACIPRL_07935 [Streptomyces sp. NPDC090085]|uniref:hypothetical protein n=1 Tax=Streptomyces sp. NPDC090085 TaxID=3365943 RepID=UPI0037FD233E